MYVPNSFDSSSFKSGSTSRITLGIRPLLIVSAGTFCPIACAHQDPEGFLPLNPPGHSR